MTCNRERARETESRKKRARAHTPKIFDFCKSGSEKKAQRAYAFRRATERVKNNKTPVYTNTANTVCAQGNPVWYS